MEQCIICSLFPICILYHIGEYISSVLTSLLRFFTCVCYNLCFFIVTETDFLFLCVADCFGVFLTMWSVESQILTSGLADDLLLFVHDFISFFFISSDKYICWQEVTIKPSWNFTSLNSFFTDVCYNEFPQIHAQIYPTPENSTFWIHIVKLPKIGRPNPQQTYYPPPLKFSGFLGLWCPPFLCSTLYTYPKSSLTRNMWLVMKDLKPHLSRGFFFLLKTSWQVLLYKPIIL